MNKNEWISVDDRLPEVFESVNTKTDDNFEGEAWYDGCDWWDSVTAELASSDYTENKITHWKILETP